MRTVRAAGLVLATAAAIAWSSSGCAALFPTPALPPCQPNALGACTVIDGYPVGVMARDCGSDGAACGDAGRLARLALDAREPNHPPPISVQQFEPDMARICGPELCAFSSTQSIVVFTFADGTQKATGYQCQGVAPCVGTLTWNGYGNAIHGD